MKEIIGAVIVIAGIWGGTRVLVDLYKTVRKAALEKASQGLPSLTEMNRGLNQRKSTRPAPAEKQAPNVNRP